MLKLIPVSFMMTIKAQYSTFLKLIVPFFFCPSPNPMSNFLFRFNMVNFHSINRTAQYALLIFKIIKSPILKPLVLIFSLFFLVFICHVRIEGIAPSLTVSKTAVLSVERYPRASRGTRNRTLIDALEPRCPIH